MHLLTVWQLDLLKLLRQLLLYAVNDRLCLLLLPNSCQPRSASSWRLIDCNWPLHGSRCAC
jgi:hypothetical protein